MSDGPSLSQLPGDVPQIFLNTDGTPMHVFVEAGGVYNRPLIVRKLRKSGAHICTDPKNAQIILVDEATDQGRHFIRDWGRDENKVVLKHTWIETCIKAGKALDAADRWGECMTFDDGLPIGTAADEEAIVVEKSPLPTPRETPVDTVPSSSRGRQHHAALASASSSSHGRRQSMEQFLPQTTPVPDMQENGVPPNMQNGTPYQFGTPSSNSLATNSSQFQMPFMNGLPQSQFQPGMQNMMSAFPGMQTAPNGMVAIPPQMLAALLSQQVQPYPNPQAPPFFTALADSMRAHGMAGMHPSLMYNPGSMPQSAEDIHPPPTGFNANGSAVAGISHSPTPGSSTGIYPALSPFLPPSISRRFSDSSASSSASLKHSLKSKGKHKEVSSSHPQDKASSKMVSGFKTIFSSQPKSHSGGGIFTSKNGEGLSFYVQVELHNRKEVVPAIKKNGGKITSDLLAADYVVLQTRATDFKQLCKAAVEAGGYAVNAQFVHECIKQNALLDPTTFLHAPPKNKRKRPPSPERPSLEEGSEGEEGNSLDEKEKKRIRKNELQREYLKRLKEKKNEKNLKEKKSPEKKPTVAKPTKRAKVDATSALAAPTVNKGPRSPSPPAPHTRETLNSAGHYKYSEHEREYVPRYVKVLLERDHLMSDAAIGLALFNKMPNHSAQSWRTYIRQNARTEIDALRKRAAIAYRKALSQNEAREAQEQAQEASHVAAAVLEEPSSSSTTVAATSPVPLPPPEPPISAPSISEPPISEPPISEPPISEPLISEPPVSEPPISEPLAIGLPATDPPAPAPEPTASQPPASDTSSAWKAQEEEDLNTLAQFFAFDGGDEEGLEDTEVWGRLRGYATCKTAGSWEDFWQLHNEEVHKRYQRLIETEASPNALEGSA